MKKCLGNLPYSIHCDSVPLVHGQRMVGRFEFLKKSSTYSAWALSRQRASAFLRLAYPSVDRSTSSSPRILSMVAAGAQTPREKTLRPFFSWTIQWGPAALTLRVKAASPGGSNTPSSGAVSTLPSPERTAFGVGPGVKVMAAILSLLRCSVSNQASTNQGSS
jgi:hypothetical protein